MLFSWLPFQSLSLWSVLGGYLDYLPAFEKFEMTQEQKQSHRRLMPIAVALAYSNSALNPILYAFTLKPFRLTLNENLRWFCSPLLMHRTASDRKDDYKPINQKNLDHLHVRTDLTQITELDEYWYFRFYTF